MTTIASPKPHFLILDALRGVAALTVVAFHLLEAHATSHLDQLLNHGYLAVDFFFLLSGFVIAYAYDDRWKSMTLTHFFKRRLIRLQPMVVVGMLVGALLFFFQEPALWPQIAETPIWQVLLVTVLGCLMIPVSAGLDVRGWQEMYPLNGPGWTLFFEYLANILYALVLRRLPVVGLTILVVLAAGLTLHLGLTSSAGDFIGGWSLDPKQLHIGAVRLLFPFVAGILLFRVRRQVTVRRAFLWCSLLLVVVLAMPRVGGAERLWLNGLYDALTVILIFPLIVHLGAGAITPSPRLERWCKFLGDISYPIYITHFPLILLYFGWVAKNKASIAEGWPYALLLFGLSVALAYAALKWIDEPVRRWLTRK